MSRRILGLVLVAYLAVVAFGVFGPSPGEQVSRAARGLRKVELEVRSTVTGRSGHHPDATSPTPTLDWPYGDVSAEDLANTALFVPFGLLFPLIWPRWRWWTIPAGVVLSAAIELSQMVIFSWRSASVEDIGWNSLGTMIGFVLWLASSWLWRHARARSTPSASAPDGQARSAAG